MKYLIYLILFLSLLSCQNDAKQSHQKNETTNLTTPSKANQSNVNSNSKPTIPEPEINTLVFVCNYGFDKSVIAASYFNEVMKNKRLHYKAISRAAEANLHETNSIPTAILTDILSTGLTLQTTNVTTLSETEVNSAYKIICLDKPLENLKDHKNLIFWKDIPPLKAGIDKTTSIIKEKVDKLVKEIGC